MTIGVSTFGDPSWAATAQRVALPSADALGVPVIHAHADTLAEARNRCLRLADTEWIIHLDADDELEPGYLDAMSGAAGDVRAPSVRYVVPSQPDPAPIMPRVVWPSDAHHHDCTGACLVYGNWVVVGACARVSLLRDIGGWRDFALEDWDLWLRCHLAGADVQAAPAAVYRAHGRLSGRGLGNDPAASLAAHRAVAVANHVPIP